MADQLATPDDLAALLQTPVDPTTATLLLETATAVVQAAVRQRLIQVTDDTVELRGDHGHWLTLPERPVTAVSAVEVEGIALTVDVDYLQYQWRLYRYCGWLSNLAAISTASTRFPDQSRVTVTYSHGYAAGDQRLQLARQATLSLAAGAYSSPGGAVTQERIDDYMVMYDTMATQLNASAPLAGALRRQYSIPASTVRM